LAAKAPGVGAPPLGISVLGTSGADGGGAGGVGVFPPGDVPLPTKPKAVFTTFIIFTNPGDIKLMMSLNLSNKPNKPFNPPPPPEPLPENNPENQLPTLVRKSIFTPFCFKFLFFYFGSF
jgi:hypothetical protein